MAEQTPPPSESSTRSHALPATGDSVADELLRSVDTKPREQQRHIRVVLSSDTMQALLSLSADPPAPYPFTAQAIVDALSERGVVHGILKWEIQQIVARQEYVSDFPVAVGTAPELGQDARIELFFDPSTKVQLSETDHRVDWREVSLIATVTQNQLLARRIPAIRGKPGVTVTGRPVEPPRVREVRLHHGQGTKLNEKDPNELLAATAGAAKLVNDRIVVESLLVISRDVDFSVGNIDFHGNVQISGSVMPGFHVRSAGDVQVRGSVESATIESGGSVSISQGILGQSGRTAVTAAKDVIARLAWNAVIVAGGNVTIQSEAVNCNLRSGGVISVGMGAGKRGRIAGGEISAAKAVHTADLGAESATKTVVAVDQEGYLARVMARKDRLDKIARLEKDHATIVSKVGMLLGRKLGNAAEWTEAHENVMSQLALSANQIEEELMVLQEEEPPPPAAERPKVVVSGTLFPGVKVSIGHLTKVFSDRLTQTQVVVTDDYSAILTVRL